MKKTRLGYGPHFFGIVLRTLVRLRSLVTLYYSFLLLTLVQA